MHHGRNQHRQGNRRCKTKGKSENKYLRELFKIDSWFLDIKMV